MSMKLLQIILLGIVLILCVGSLVRLYRARLESFPLNHGRLSASLGVLVLMIGLLLPWSTYPSDLGQERSVTKGTILEDKGLSENLDEPSTLPFLSLAILASWIVYRKQEQPGDVFSVALSILGFVMLGVAWYLFTFIEQKTSLISTG